MHSKFDKWFIEFKSSIKNVYKVKNYMHGQLHTGNTCNPLQALMETVQEKNANLQLILLKDYIFLSSSMYFRKKGVQSFPIFALRGIITRITASICVTRLEFVSKLKKKKTVTVRHR